MSGKTITIRDPETDLIRQIKLLTGKGTASQAFIAAAHRAISLDDQVTDLREELRKERERVQVLQRVLADAHSAAVQLAEIAGQGDMFDPANVLRPGYRR
ncbi:hypothetical protein [Ectopseudomonas khazarica]|uniref:hypothetical protein n=1 Tax=Ectopseudomonas khazarica TaxID=2502979 RepID=UPI0037CAC1DC